MIHTNNPIIKHKVGLLNLADELGNVSRACKVSMRFIKDVLNKPHTFQKRFPDIQINVQVDLSKYHDARFDLALATGGLVPDVVQLQTLHDFDYWKEQGVLEHYKPKDWDKVYPAFKDPQGAWTGLYGLSFSNLINVSLISEEDAPRDALDYLDPALKGKVVLTYPHDDDAVLYQFWHLKEKYGWDYISKLIANELSH